MPHAPAPSTAWRCCCTSMAARAMLRIEGQRDSDGRPRQRIRNLVAGVQGFDNLNRNRLNGSYHAFHFRHSDAFWRILITIDNYLLSIVLDTESQISDSESPEPGKSSPPGLRSTRGRNPDSPLPSSGCARLAATTARLWPTSASAELNCRRRGCRETPCRPAAP